MSPFVGKEVIERVCSKVRNLAGVISIIEELLEPLKCGGENILDAVRQSERGQLHGGIAVVLIIHIPST